MSEGITAFFGSTDTVLQTQTFLRCDDVVVLGLHDATWLIFNETKYVSRLKSGFIKRKF